MDTSKSEKQGMPKIAKEVVISLIASTITAVILWFLSKIISLAKNELVFLVIFVIVIFVVTLFLLFNNSFNNKFISKLIFRIHQRYPDVIYQNDAIKSDIISSLNNEVKDVGNRELLHNILNATAINSSYNIIKEEITYTFESEEYATYRVHVVLKANEPINSYRFRFAWSGDHGGISVPELATASKNKKFRIEEDLDMLDLITGKKKSVPEDEQGYRYYKVVFGKKAKTPKSGEVDFEYIVICKGKSRPFLEVSIKDAVENLSLKIEFSKDIKVSNVQTFEFIHSNDDIQYDEPDALVEEVTKAGEVSHRYIEYKVSKPFLGGKYEINWDW